MSLPVSITPTDVLIAARLAAASYTGKPDAMNVVESYQGAPLPMHVVWEGSVTAADWLRDFEAIPNDTGEFIGFAEQARMSSMKLADVLTSRNVMPPSVTLVGHSRGGAIALLVAVHLHYTWSVQMRLHGVASLPIRVITFGAPNPGSHLWKKTAMKLGIDALRVEVAYDPVVHAVPWWYSATIGETLHLDHDGTELGRIRGGWATLRYWLRWKLGDRRDHSVAGYCSVVEQWALKLAHDAQVATTRKESA